MRYIGLRVNSLVCISGLTTEGVWWVYQYLVRAVPDSPHCACREIHNFDAFIAVTLDVQVNLVLAERGTHVQVQLHPAKAPRGRGDDATKVSGNIFQAS